LRQAHASSLRATVAATASDASAPTNIAAPQTASASARAGRPAPHAPVDLLTKELCDGEGVHDCTRARPCALKRAMRARRRDRGDVCPPRARRRAPLRDLARGKSRACRWLTHARLVGAGG
jgi:hypothetical protein